MPQFDVHRNPGALRDTVPFVVVVQSALFDGYRRRVVVPLVRRNALPAGSGIVPSRLNPEFEIEGERVVLHPLDMVSVPTSALGARVGSLGSDGQAITDALDELLSRAWG
ncbi:toxin CcdB [Tibeticola sediminis]|uniref:Toxin CcdB n=1 Tax=Tibeticola sediminis TaxID=1917811 RepID=A0A3N4V6K3_9BURK|nr:CcdB family protein [Tibeticola sediminis]RPE72727.1 toxin CcdB [Tibeticola sediminis]